MALFKSRYLRRPAVLFLIVALSSAVTAKLGSGLIQSESRILVRAIEFSEKISLPFPDQSSHVRVWIPIPANDPYQKTDILKVDSPFDYKIFQDKDFGNRFFYMDIKSPLKSGNLSVEVLYQILRKEQKANHLRFKIWSAQILNYLKPRGLEQINEKIERIAREETKNKSAPLEKAKALYDYVLSHMQYDKSGTGWGLGNSVYACEVGKGNCTDFHSLFISLMRAVNIPARFRTGFSLPEAPSGEPLGSYHCWAEFHVRELGWVPVDISEAWKNPEKRDYFFGNLDPNRVLLTTGREIILSPPQEGEPLNYFSKPYVELNGMEVNNFKLERKFRNL